jgi:hypothetical protein
MNNFEQPNTTSAFPSNLEKFALFVAIVPFIFYDWDGTAGHSFQGIYNVYALIGGISAVSFIPFIFLQFKKLPQAERIQHLILIMIIDAVAIIHILYGLGFFNS